jgi:hypothetical protein
MATTGQRRQVKTGTPTGARRPAPNSRDTQQLRVYRAEKMAHHLLLGEYWTQSMTELQVLELMEQVLGHPGVLARWGEHTATVTFPTRGTTAWSERPTGRIHLPPGTRNPLTVVHEIAHLLAPERAEADHGPGFIAIYRYLILQTLGEEAYRIIDAAFTALGVKSDDSQIPPVRPGYPHKRGEGVPGLLPGQAAMAAEIVRAAAHAGVFGEAGVELRAAAYNIARRMKNLDPAPTKERKGPARIPETVTVPVASLLRADTRDDVAELVLGAVRKSMDPKTMLPPPEAKKRKKSPPATSSTTASSTRSRARRLPPRRKPKKK